MAAVVGRIVTPGEFWAEIVEPDVADFLQQPQDLRRAVHCAISLFHVADWVFATRKASVQAAFQIARRALSSR